jgi:hypothetical protein
LSARISDTDEVCLSPPIDALLRCRLELEATAAAPVPCGSCTACCRLTGPISVAEDEAVPALQLESDANGVQWLPRNPDGSCRHIGAAGCAVYAHRPRACRHYDCRVAAGFGVQAPAAPDHPFPQWQHAAFNQDDATLNALAKAIGILVVAEQDGQPWSVGAVMPRMVALYFENRSAALGGAA